MKSEAPTSDETDVTELEIGPDGRVYVFGASPEVLEILESLRAQDESFRERLERGRSEVAIPISAQTTRIE